MRMRPHEIVVVLLLLISSPKVFCKNPFANLVSRFGGAKGPKSSSSSGEEKAQTQATSEASKGEAGNIFEGPNDALKLRSHRELSNVRINSRDDVLTAAINAVSSVSSAFIYFYLIKTAVKSVRDLVLEVTKATTNNTSAALPSGFETRYIPQNVTLNSYELDILGSSVVDPLEIDTEFDAIGGLENVKQGLLDCCDLCLGLDLIGDLQGVEEDNYDDEEEEEVVSDSEDIVRVDDKANTTTTLNSTSDSRGGVLSQRSATLLRPIQGVLLHGPPGCGKTALTRSLSKKCGLPMIQLSPSTLLRKWVGDTSQLTKAIFTLCHKLQPCLLFIDEMDGLFRSRREDDNAVDRQVKTEFMQLWDELGRRKDCRVLVVGATNRPQDLDAAIQRRFERSYFVGMPDEQARLVIIRKLLKGSDITVAPHFDHSECAGMTGGYSPSDIVNLLKAAACIPLRELQRARRRRSSGTGAGGGVSRAPRPLSLADVEEAAQTLGRPASAAHQWGRPQRSGDTTDTGEGDGSLWQMGPPPPSLEGDAGGGMGLGGGGYEQPPLPFYQHSHGYDDQEYHDDDTYSDDDDDEDDEESDEGEDDEGNGGTDEGKESE